jgi:hypothetical protein
LNDFAGGTTRKGRAARLRAWQDFSSAPPTNFVGDRHLQLSCPTENDRRKLASNTRLSDCVHRSSIKRLFQRLMPPARGALRRHSKICTPAISHLFELNVLLVAAGRPAAISAQSCG